ncbi:MAG: 16S rRNA (guanine(966)-N(2))-methyltransferase RsmD [Planctomycetota bacterium]|jgi:16S rRNA (guanine966-N2)-methyltransferase
MRIIAGKAKGRRLNIPYEYGARPFLEKARGALFNILNKQIKNAIVLDLYAGSGALGIEALSRGAAESVFIERDKDSSECLRGNLESCGFSEFSEIINASVEQALPGINKSFDLIFIDPPFPDSADWAVELSSLKITKNTVKLLAENGTIIVRFEKQGSYPEFWEDLPLSDCRKYGRSVICFYRVNR